MMEWIIPCNEKLYNHRDAFNNLDYIDWRQSTNVKEGDVVYIYVGRPTSSILYNLCFFAFLKEMYEIYNEI